MEIRPQSVLDLSPSRRQFLHAAAGGALAALATARGLAQPPAAAAGPAAQKAVWRWPFKLGVASYTFRKVPLDQTLAMTVQTGVECICLKSMHLPMDATPEEIKAVAAKVRQAGLILDGCGVVVMRDEAQVRQAFEYAKTGQMKKIVAAPSEEMLGLLNELIPKYDIQVCSHHHGPGDKHFPTPESAYQKIQTFDKRFGLCIDIGHTVRYGADLYDSTERYADRLLDVHMKDVTEATAKGKTTEVGRGVIDIPRFLKTLIKIGYAATVSYEYEANPDNPLPGLMESVNHTRKVLAAL